jgi:uncharacterized membrane protein
MRKNKKLDFFHVSFEIALILKAINGLFEIAGGVLLTFLNQGNLNRIIAMLTQGELSEDPKDVFAAAILHFSENFSISSQHFGIFYLISHGIIKLILVVILWRKNCGRIRLPLFFWDFLSVINYTDMRSAPL